MDVWDLLSFLGDTLSQFCPVQFFPSAGIGSAQVLDIQGQRYRVLKQIGEGGYAFVYLAKPLPGGQLSAGVAAQPVAIKKILAGSAEQLAAAKNEVAVLQALSHVNCLPLLAHSITQSSSAAAGRAYEVLLVFPAYQDGTLLDELDRLAVEGSRLSSRQVLEIFRQICAGVSHMHSRGFAHMDLKPHNVLIKRPATAQQQQQRRLLTAAVTPASIPRPGSRPRIRATALPDSDEEVDLEASASLVARGYQAIIMDFGSARRMPVTVNSRQQALTVQEDAEAHCTATFRAPELFDVPSHCMLTTAVDVWALGCTLYSMMYGGASPFQQALDQGASLALAVMNCRIPWPTSAASRAYPDPLHKLVSFCLEVDPARRPSVPQVLQRVDDLLAQQLGAQRAAGPTWG